MTNRIREIRKARGLTLKEMAEACNATESAASRWEKSPDGPRPDVLKRLAQVLKVDWRELVSEPGAAPGMADEATRYDPEPASPLSRIHLDEHQYLYMLRGDHLNAIGLLDGDALVVSGAAAVVKGRQTGDVVVAQHHDRKTPLQAVTLVRQYVAPALLITNSMGQNLESINMAAEDCQVLGVVV